MLRRAFGDATAASRSLDAVGLWPDGAGSSVPPSFEGTRNIDWRGKEDPAHFGSDRAGAEAATSDIDDDHKIIVAADFSDLNAVESLWETAVNWRW